MFEHLSDCCHDADFVGQAAPQESEEDRFHAPARPQGRALPTKKNNDDDEWGNGMLGDDLLPGM